MRSENRRAQLLTATLLLCFGGAAHSRDVAGPRPPAAEFVLRHGRIYTMDAARSWAQSIAVTAGRIAAVGSDGDVAQLMGPQTVVIDLGGRFVLPSFIDSHVHPIQAGIALGQCNLADKQTKEEVCAAVRDYARANPRSSWILGGSWQLPVFPGANPHKEWLDEIVPERPVFLTAADGHSAWVNSKALALAGVTRTTPDPVNGRIERDERREPTGTLRESAIDLIEKVAPVPSEAERYDGLMRALKIMNGFGITGFHDASTREPDLKAYAEAERQGKLTAHVSAALYADPEGDVPHVLAQLAALEKLREQYRGPDFRASAVKIFADGVIEANTAALLQP